jgi:hypothetical protein
MSYMTGGNIVKEETNVIIERKGAAMREVCSRKYS